MTTAPVPEDTALLRRALALLVLLVVADLWAYHHFGVGLRNIGVPVWIAAAIGAATKVAGFVLGDDKIHALTAKLAERVRKFVQPLVTPGVLGFAAAVLASLMLTVSSVTIVSDAGGDDTRIAVTPLEEKPSGTTRALKHDAGVTRIVVATTPFGRIFRVAASGYVSGTFAVYPPVGLRVTLGTDLSALSTALFRPDPALLGYLADGAELRVYRVGHGPDSLVAADTGHSTSFLLGRPRAIRPDLVDDWTRELTAAGADAASIAQTITLWKRQTPLPTKGELSPGDRLRAEVRMNGTLVGAGEVTLGADPLLDVPLRSVTAGTGAAP